MRAACLQACFLVCCSVVGALRWSPSACRGASSCLHAVDVDISSAASPEPAASGGGKPKLFIFGLGYIGTAFALHMKRQGWQVYGTCTDALKAASMRQRGIGAFVFDDWRGGMMQEEPLAALLSSTHILSTIPPTLASGADPVLLAHGDELLRARRRIRWLAYLSSTGVYGERRGGWVASEAAAPREPLHPRARLRLAAERSWSALAACPLQPDRHGGGAAAAAAARRPPQLPLEVFRLAAVYGPGRSALEAVAACGGDLVGAGLADDAGLVSRVHVADVCAALGAAAAAPRAGRVVNVADDLPSTRYEALAYAAALMGYPRQDPDEVEFGGARSRSSGRRVDNSAMRALLRRARNAGAASATIGSSSSSGGGADCCHRHGLLLFPTYLAGLDALHAGDNRPLQDDTVVESGAGSAAAAAAAPLLGMPRSTCSGGGGGGGDGARLDRIEHEMRGLSEAVMAALAEVRRHEGGAQGGG